MQLLACWHLYIDVSCMHLLKRFDRNLTSSDPNLQRSAATDVGFSPGPRVHSPPDVADAGGAEAREAAGRCAGCWPNIAAGGGHSMRQLVANFESEMSLEAIGWNGGSCSWFGWICWFLLYFWILSFRFPFTWSFRIEHWENGPYYILVQQWVERVIRCQCGYMFWLDLMGKPSLWRWVRTIR